MRTRTTSTAALPWTLLLAGAVVVAGAGTTVRAENTAPLQLDDLPAEIRQVVTGERALRGNKIQSLSIARYDLDHDGREEWVVTAVPRDRAGFAPVNRPTWIFNRDGVRWRQQIYLGTLTRAEVLPGPGHDTIRTLTKDGARLRCTLYRWQRDRYEAATCPAPGPAAAAPKK